MSNTVPEIVNRLEKRRKRLRSWVTKDSHPLVVAQVRDAHGALGAMPIGRAHLLQETPDPRPRDNNWDQT